MRAFRIFLCSLLLCPMGAMHAIPVFAVAQASVKIEQLTASRYGTWTILSADGSTVTSEDPGIDKKSYSLGITEFGPMTLSVVPPPGMSAKILVYRGGDVIKTVTSQQYSFSLYTNDNYRFVVQYALTKLGSLGITSEPSGVRFRMKGDGGRTYTGVTPKTINNIPAGRYSIDFSTVRGCVQPGKHTAVVEIGERNTTHATLPCTSEQEATVDTSRISRRSLRDYAERREYNERGNRK